MEERSKSSWLDRLGLSLSRVPEDREDLVELLHSAFERNVLDADALAMIEGVLQVGEVPVRDVMIPRSQMDVVCLEDSPETLLAFVVEARHSRFPVIGTSKDDIQGILLAKDLLRYVSGVEKDLRGMLRPAVFIPESKRLNVLLKDFRKNRNHMAIVVDEYGGVAGLVTIEDVMEQIVGDIEDEYDFDETEDNILLDEEGRWRVKAITEIADFNQETGATLDASLADTIGGLITACFGRVPKRGETAECHGFRFKILRADSRRLHTLLVEPLKPLL